MSEQAVKTQHTAGPWTGAPPETLNWEPGFGGPIGNADYSHIAFIYSKDGDDSGQSPGEPEDRANYFLVKSAPDLLAACKTAANAIDDLFVLLIDITRGQPYERFMPSQSGQPWEALLELRAAIAKAEPE